MVSVGQESGHGLAESSAENFIRLNQDVVWGCIMMRLGILFQDHWLLTKFSALHIYRTEDPVFFLNVNEEMLLTPRSHPKVLAT